MRTRTRQPAVFSAIEPFFEMRGLFDEMPWGRTFGEGAALPKVDISETEKSFIIKADLPGVKRDEIDVSLKEGVLTISAETSSEHEEKEEGEVIRRERYSGTFRRRMNIGRNVDQQNVSANFDDGVLTLTLPKVEPAQPEAKRIPIQ